MNLAGNNNSVLVSDIQKLHHMLGTFRNRPGERNYFAAVLPQEKEAMQRLETAGLVKHLGDEIYKATLDGCKLIGLGPAAIKRALP